MISDVEATGAFEVRVKTPEQGGVQATWELVHSKLATPSAGFVDSEAKLVGILEAIAEAQSLTEEEKSDLRAAARPLALLQHLVVV